MNPNASTFVPKFGPAPTAAAPVKSAGVLVLGAKPAAAPTPAPAPTPAKPAEVKPTEEAKPTQTQPETGLEKPTAKLTVEEDEPITEAERAELKRMAEEEGVSVEELLKKDAQGKGKDEEVVERERVEDSREHLNVVFIGHVDAGKSTISGQILFATGKVDQRTIEKYERESKEKNRESWFLAYIMDTNEEERTKGITVEVGRATFETPTKRYTILDAPGHKAYVPNMIGGASQADVGILVISARKGEFETGFNRGGQSREHAMLAKTLGIKYIIVVINKMDDDTVNWSKERYDEIVDQLTPFLKSTGYNTKSDVFFVPISGLKGVGVVNDVSKEFAPWYSGLGLLNTLDSLKSIERNPNAPLRIPVIDKHKDRGFTMVLGKVEAGTITRGDQLFVMPGRIPVEVQQLFLDETDSVRRALPGENLRVLLKGIEEENVHRGYVLCDRVSPVPCVTKFECQLAIVELLAHKPIFSAGYKAVIHTHTAVEECTLIVILSQLDKTGKVIKKKPGWVKAQQVCKAILEISASIPCELFSDTPQLGRFTLRDEGKTIAIGKITSFGPKKAAN